MTAITTAAPQLRRGSYLRPLLAVGVALLGALALLGAAGGRINTSKSIRLGLYWTSERRVQKGEYVLFCPPQIVVFEEARRRGYLAAGFCPGGYGFLMKRVLAAKGDTVAVADDGVRVNGKLLPFSAPLAADRAGRPMPRYQASQYVLGASEVLLMTDVSPTSFDGRYFGPVNLTQIRTVVVPLLTW
ncbi:MAG: conjugative transfer signal peptidase TraF [Terriglobales bacterium]